MEVHGPYYVKEKTWLFGRLKASKLWKKANAEPDKLTEKQKETLINGYKQKVKYMDYHLGQLLKEIYDPESLIIITADHGELLGEHGLFGHPSELYENLLRIPLLIKLPDSLSIYIKTKQIDIRVRSVDIVPTILDILEITSETNLDGCSLLPLIKGIKQH